MTDQSKGGVELVLPIKAMLASVYVCVCVCVCMCVGVVDSVLYLFLWVNSAVSVLTHM